ncbi:MAG: ABC transporter ATP-binding protein [Candidatus Hodarchaeota archaeon]
MTAELLNVKDLEIHFRTPQGTVKALNGVNLTMSKGDVMGLIGETGSGKTVTALSVMRLLPIPPAEIVDGKIFFDNKDLLGLSEDEMRKTRGKKISMVFQEPATSLNPLMKVEGQIGEVVAMHQSSNKREIKGKVIEMLSNVGLPTPKTLLNRYPCELSGGMQQRVMIAMALVCNPLLLIADEPTSSLDVTTQAQILELLTKLKNERDFSVLLITHDFNVVAEICNKVNVMYAGSIVEHGDVKTTFEDPLHPYTDGLLKALPNPHVKRLLKIPGSLPDLIHPPSGCRFNPRCREAKTKCSQKKPKLVEIRKGHAVACHLFN